MQSIEVELKQAIQSAVKKAFDLDLDVQNIVVETPKNKDHGDFSSNGCDAINSSITSKSKNDCAKLIRCIFIRNGF